MTTHASFAVIQNAEGKYLLQKRDGNAPLNPNKWAPFGGGAEEGESPTQTLVRELKEEIEFEIQASDLEHLCTVDSKTRDEKRYIYYIKKTLEADDVVLHEGEKFAYFTVQEAAKDSDMLADTYELLRLHAGV